MVFNAGLVSGIGRLRLQRETDQNQLLLHRRACMSSKSCPFGLCNAPATFQRLMNLVLAGVQWSECLVYLDDIIILGRIFEEHLKHLSTVLQKLRQANLCLKPSKCALLRQEVVYFGHKISSDGVSTDSTKVDKVVSWPTQPQSGGPTIPRTGVILSKVFT